MKADTKKPVWESPKIRGPHIDAALIKRAPKKRTPISRSSHIN